ncbi:hypothetical protein HPB50_009500 [Hyalomma asiaticum]|uniref:Uncharacterized protein n=1 Tax=Hyalomma asiaticum TaxID=266040 RepID=A0ACB7RRA0_HYAAI|nr:hypothetical protein HPB50_009500 [Hyalomma asiaticum]
MTPDPVLVPGVQFPAESIFESECPAPAKTRRPKSCSVRLAPARSHSLSQGPEAVHIRWWYGRGAHRRRYNYPIHRNDVNDVTAPVTAAISTLMSELSPELKASFNTLHQIVLEVSDSFPVAMSSTEASLADFNVQLAKQRLNKPANLGHNINRYAIMAPR